MSSELPIVIKTFKDECLKGLLRRSIDLLHRVPNLPKVVEQIGLSKHCGLGSDAAVGGF